jgi:hypothetical protein
MTSGVNRFDMRCSPRWIQAQPHLINKACGKPSAFSLRRELQEHLKTRKSRLQFERKIPGQGRRSRGFPVEKPGCAGTGRRMKGSSFLPVTFEWTPKSKPGPGDRPMVLEGRFLGLGLFRDEAFCRSCLGHFHRLEDQFFVQHHNLSFRFFVGFLGRSVPAGPIRRCFPPLWNKKRPGPDLFGSRPGFSANGT